MEEPLRQITRRWAFPVLVSAAVVAAAGCGAASSSQVGQVASIPSSAPAHSTTTAVASAGGSSATGGITVSPQERLDDTPQQIDAIISVWNDCLAAHGATYGNVPGVAGSKNLANIPASAYAACKSKQPIEAPQLNPSLNPHYRADWLADVSCLRAHGVLVDLTQDSSGVINGWTYDSANTGTDSPQLDQTCMMQAFGGKQ